MERETLGFMTADVATAELTQGCTAQMSTLEGAVRFLSIVFVCGPVLFFLAMFVDLFLQNIELPFTNASLGLIGLVSVGSAFVDMVRNLSRES